MSISTPTIDANFPILEPYLGSSVQINCFGVTKHHSLIDPNRIMIKLTLDIEKITLRLFFPQGIMRI